MQQGSRVRPYKLASRPPASPLSPTLICHAQMLEEEDGTGQLLIVSGGGGGRLKHRTNKRPRHWSSSLPSPASSSSSRSGSTTTQQEEDEEADVAKCLILLAQGPAVAVEPQPPIVMPAPETPRSTSRMYAGVSSSYECKTCNKCFPSFQALGGHRTSHSNDRKKQQPRRPEQEAAAAAVTTTLSLRTAATGRPAAHECSACGTTFASGQALGGHMRRHRPLTMSAAAPESVVTADDSSNSNGRRLLLLQERSAGGNHHVNLELDLNLLPAPSTEQEVTSPAKRMMHHNLN